MCGSPGAREHTKLPRVREESEGISGRVTCWGKAVLGLGTHVKRPGFGVEVVELKAGH